MSIIVQKFGGTSLANKQRLKAVASIIEDTIQQGVKPIVVVSAAAGITDGLVKNVEEFKNYDMREYDAIVSSGEIISAGLLAIHLNNLGIKAQSLQAWQIKIHSDNRFGCAKIKMIENQSLFKMLDNQIVPVICGFQGLHNDNITTLGRGGSDTTAVAIAVAVAASRCDIYTDVDGIYTLDPKKFKEAKRIDHIIYDQIINMAYSGAKVLNHRAARIGKKYNVLIRILSSFEGATNGTTISNKTMYNIEESTISAITVSKNLYLVKIQYQFLPTSFNILDISHQKDGYVATIEITEKDIPNVKDYILQQHGPFCKVTLTGHNLKEDNALIDKIFKIADTHKVKIMECNWGEISIGLYVENYSDDFISTLHSHFIS